MFNLKEIVEGNPLREDPSESKIFTVGSLKGNLNQLQNVITEIETCNYFAENDRIVFLGDFLGEGEDNREIINTLYEYQELRSDQVVILKGAVEQRFIISKKTFFETKVGKATLDSYRETVIPPFVKAPKESLNASELADNRGWVESLPSFFVSERYYFVHGGVDGTRPLDKQDSQTIMFIKERSFIEGETNYERLVVHSHIGKKVEKKKNRISLPYNSEDTLIAILNDTKKEDTLDVVRVFST